MNPLSATLALKQRIAIPRLGLGVYQAGHGRATEDVVHWALKAGYRHVDTAAMYRNEAEVGATLRRAIGAGRERWACCKTDRMRATLPRSSDSSAL